MSLPRYSEYKDSGVAWLGVVPGHWDVKPIKAVASCNDEVLEESTPEDFEIEYVEISGVESGYGVASTEIMPFGKAPSRARRRVADGDVLVSTVRTYLRAIAPVINPRSNLIASTGFAVVRPRLVEPHYLGYVFQAEYLISEVISRSVGVSYPAINASELMRLNVPIPSEREQQTIAAFLVRETGKIDALIAEQQRLVELLAEKRQAVISNAVTKGLNPNVKMKDSGIEWLGEVPEHWGHSRLAYACSLIVDGTHHSPESHLEGEYRYITAKNIKESGFDFSEITYLTDDDHKEIYTRCPVRKNDVLYIKDGATAGIAMVNHLEEEFSLLSSVAMIRPKTNLLLSKYLVYQLNVSQFKSDALAKLLGGAMTRFTLDSISRFTVVLPPLEEQAKIVSSLDTEIAKFDTLTAEANRAVELLQERRSALISAAVTGKIDVRSISTIKEAA